MTERRVRRTFNEEKKDQLVQLFNHSKPRSEIVRGQRDSLNAPTKVDYCRVLEVAHRVTGKLKWRVCGKQESLLFSK